MTSKDDPISAPAPRTALVTGATGFIGGNLVRRLLNDRWSVNAIVRRDSDRTNSQAFGSRVRWHVHDGTIEGMQDIVALARPEVVFHLGSHFLPQHRPSDISTLVRSNIEFGTQLLEAMSSCNVRCLVNAGTSWQHYEGRDYSAVCLYAATKQAFEDIVSYYVDANGVQAITLVLFDTYGPGDRRPKLFGQLMTAVESGTVIPMSGGEQMLDLVYIDDVVAAFIIAAERLSVGLVRDHERYAVSSGKHYSLKSVVQMFGEVINRRVPVEWGARPYRRREVFVPWGGGQALPKWKADVTLREGLRRTVNRS